MKTGDNVIGVMQKAASTPEFAKTSPVNPPVVKIKMKPINYTMGVFKRIHPPPHKVAIQLKDLIPVSTAIIMAAAAKKAFLSISITLYYWEHVIGPNNKTKYQGIPIETWHEP